MHSRKSIAGALASAFVAGSIDVEELVERGSRLMGRRWRWLRPLARRIAQAHSGAVRPRRSAIEKFILLDQGFARAYVKYELRLTYEVGNRPTMCPIDAANAWDVYYPISTARELADWLGLSLGELGWFADQRRLEYKQNGPKLRHYRYRALTKRFGQTRLIEAPKPRLKAIQRQILTGILDHVPPHAAAHGFRRSRSIRTFAEPHVARDVVIKLDLNDFFPSIRVAQVQALFRSIGYPESVADALAGLCTNSTPNEVWDDGLFAPRDPRIHQQIQKYRQPHLPQGAPTSPAVANLCAYRMDCRLKGLADSASATYTRYADDLAFSGDGDFQRVAKRFHYHACAIAMEEGFSVHHRKTRIMRQGVRQRIAGIVVNQGLNIPREDFDRLKATLTNCIRLGAQTQNRDGHDDFRSHLEGRVSFVEMVNPARGRRLRDLLDQVQW